MRAGMHICQSSALKRFWNLPAGEVSRMERGGGSGVSIRPDERGLAKIEESVREHEGRPDALISVLRKIQQALGYLPEEALVRVARTLNVPLSKVYGVATFYSLFAVGSRKGTYIIRVCENAPCHVLGAREVIRALEGELGIKMGGTTPDGRFTLEYTSCLGVCGVAPAIMINDDVYGNLTPQRVRAILSEYR